MAVTRLWTLFPLHVGLCFLGEQHVYDDAHSDDVRKPFAMYAYLAVCGEQKVLIDLGPKRVDWMNRMFQQYGFFRVPRNGDPGPDDIRQPQGNVLAHLQRRAIPPQEISHIVFTHLHADHHGMDTPETAGALLDFPNAVFHLSRRGWAANLALRRNGHWGSYVDWTFSDYIEQCTAAGRTRIEDNAEVLPGIRTLYLGGHAPCSQAVIVDTAYGPVMITSDEVYHYDLLAAGVLARIFVTPQALLDATERIVRWAEEYDGILLPVHDPQIHELTVRFGDAWPEQARVLTQDAIAGFRCAVPTINGKPIDVTCKG